MDNNINVGEMFLDILGNKSYIPLDQQCVAVFGKVNKEEWLSAVDNLTDTSLSFFGETPETLYDNIKMPNRATVGSAGYDIYTPFDIDVKAGEWCELPLGINCEIRPGWFLMLMPKSGLGFKYGMRFANTMGIIDSDYVNADNGGHIKLKFTVEKDLHLNKGSKIIQGIFMQFGLVDNDISIGTRHGGFGSTGE